MTECHTNPECLQNTITLQARLRWLYYTPHTSVVDVALRSRRFYFLSCIYHVERQVSVLNEKLDTRTHSSTFAEAEQHLTWNVGTWFKSCSGNRPPEIGFL